MATTEVTTTSAFGYEGTSSATTLNLPENFAPSVDEPGSWIARNTECPLDQSEIVALKSEDVSKVVNNLKVPDNTTIIRNGVQYVIKIEEDLKSTSSNDPSFRQDDPVVMYLVVRHPNSGFITPDIITKAFTRLNQVLKDSDGNYRWKELMRLATRPQK